MPDNEFIRIDDCSSALKRIKVSPLRDDFLTVLRGELEGINKTWFKNEDIEAVKTLRGRAIALDFLIAKLSHNPEAGGRKQAAEKE